jgi:hypothetical protein
VSSAKIPNVIPKIKLGISWENLILEPLEIQKKTKRTIRNEWKK